MGVRPAVIALGAVLSVLSTPSFAETLHLNWQASVSAVRAAYPETRQIASQDGIKLEMTNVTLDGVRWKAARFAFDRSGRITAVQLVADAAQAPQLKKSLSVDDAPLWTVVEESFDQAKNGGADDAVMLCTDGAEATLTYHRPEAAVSSTTYAAEQSSADVSAG